MTSYFLWYHSKSHKRDRFFVGSQTLVFPGKPHIQKPTWDYDKTNATIFDTYEDAMKAKLFAMSSGYRNLIIEPIDETPATLPSKQEVVS